MESILMNIKRFKGYTFTQGEEFTITLPSTTTNLVSNNNFNNEVINTYNEDKSMKLGGKYVVTVKKYMTEPATPTFDFQNKWNNGVPMPLCIMEGEVIQETRGMFKMKLHGQTKVDGTFTNCMCCGRKLTNKISMFYGMGPECGGHFYINPFDSEEELKKELESVKEKISNITWEGWIIKSAIKEWEVI